MFFCKICSRQLDKEGDICIDCYEGLVEEEKAQRDNNILYSFKATFNFKYEFFKTPFIFTAILLVLIFGVIQAFQKSVLIGILSAIIYFGTYILYFLIKKIRTDSRKIDLYATKLIYTRKFHLKNKYEIKYKDIYEIQFEDLDKKKSILRESAWWTSKISQKYNMVDLFFRLNKTAENSFFTPGFFIKPVQNFKEEIMPNVQRIMNFTEKVEENRSDIEKMLNIKKTDKNKDNNTNNQKDNNTNNRNRKKKSKVHK